MTDRKMIEITSHFVRDLDDIAQFEGLPDVLEWWRSSGAPPPVTAISPFVLPRDLLPNTTLFDVEHAPRRYQVRLMGTAIAEHFGQDVTGRYLDELFSPEAHEILRDGFDYAVDEAKPHFAGRVYHTEQGKECSFSRLALPFADANGHVVRLLTASLFSKPVSTYSDVYRRARRSVVVSGIAPVV